MTRIWAASVKTATDMIAPGPLTTDAEGRPCAIELPIVLLDGYVRDRCPYVGDQAVSGHDAARLDARRRRRCCAT